MSASMSNDSKSFDFLEMDDSAYPIANELATAVSDGQTGDMEKLGISNGQPDPYAPIQFTADTPSTPLTYIGSLRCAWCTGYVQGPHEPTCEWAMFAAATWMTADTSSALPKENSSSPVLFRPDDIPSALRAPEFQDQVSRSPPYTQATLPRGVPGRTTAATGTRAGAPASGLHRRSTSTSLRTLSNRALPVQGPFAAGAEPTFMVEGLTQSAMPVFQGVFNSFDAAREAFAEPPLDIVSVQIHDDDIDMVKSQLFFDYCAQIFAATYYRPDKVPARFKWFEEDYYHQRQGKVLESIVTIVASAPYKAEARVMLLMEQVINIHEQGIPAIVAKRTSSREGYVFEPHQCSKRLNRILAAIKGDKYVAQDVLDGKGVADLARSPDRYLRVKEEHCRSNGLKKHKSNGGDPKQLRRESDARQETPSTPPATVHKTRKRHRSSLDELQTKRGRFDE